MRYGSWKQLDFVIACRIGRAVGESECWRGCGDETAKRRERHREIRGGPHLIHLAGNAGPAQQVRSGQVGHRDPSRIHQRDAGTGAGGALDARVVDRRHRRVKMRAKTARHRQGRAADRHIGYIRAAGCGAHQNMVAAHATLGIGDRRPGKSHGVAEDIIIRRTDAGHGGRGRRRNVIQFQILRLERGGAPCRVI